MTADDTEVGPEGMVPSVVEAPTRVVIDARLHGGQAGGVEMVIIGLVSALSRSRDAGFEYLILTTDGADDWIRPYVGGPCRIVAVAGDHSVASMRRGASAVGRIPVVGRPLVTWARRRWIARRGLATSDGTVEHLGADVVHFPAQAAFRTAIPSIYHPHDLQHVHLPDLFDADERADRDRIYRAFCDQATAVAVASRWVKDDLIASLGLAPDKVHVIPLAPPIAEYEELEPEAKAAHLRAWGIPSRFLFYPAQTWPHKNHARLLAAIGLLRDRGTRVHMVFTGRQTEHHAELLCIARELGIEDQLTWLGFVSAADIKALYEACTGVVVPTLFEAGSFPVMEAMMAGAPVACAAVTSLPEQVGDAALLFDPRDVAAMADAMAAIWTDADLRQRLNVRGRERVAPHTWDRVAAAFRDLYREVARSRVTVGDQRDHAAAIAVQVDRRG